MEKQSAWETIKQKIKAMNTKTLIKVVLIVGVVIYIVVSAFLDLGFDPDQIDFNEWLGKTVFLLALTMFGLLLGESLGADRQKSLENGLYQTTLRENAEILQRIDVIKLYFSDFLLWYSDKLLADKRAQIMSKSGIAKAKSIVEHVDINDVKRLRNEPLKLENGDIITKKSEKQIEVIEYALSEEVTINSYDSSYYLQTFESDYEANILESGKVIHKKKKTNIMFSRIVKIGTSIIGSIIFAGITFNEYQDMAQTEVAFSLLTRMLALFGGLLSGVLSGISDVRYEALEIKSKNEVLRIFAVSYDTREFVPTSYDDLARAEYEEYLDKTKKEEEKEIEIKECEESGKETDK